MGMGLDPRITEALNKAVEYMGEYKPATSKEAKTAIYDVTVQLATDDGVDLTNSDREYIKTQAEYYS